MNDEVLDNKLESVENSSRLLQKRVNEITDVYSSELDDYMKFVRGILRNDEEPPTDAELDDFALNLSTLIYFTSTGCEQMGIRDDLSKAAYKEAYNVARALVTTGTVADKNSQAEIDTRIEQIVNIIYSKAYKILKSKVESANEVLASVKKVMGRRQSEWETTHISSYR